jgi:amino-acid N-acetyltransferase
VVLLSALGYSPTGEAFNLSRADVAISAARVLGADKLIALGATAGVEYEGRLLRQCVAGEVALEAVDDPRGSARCWPWPSRACRRRAALPHRELPVRDALLTELFTTDGSGTLVSRRPFEQSRWASIDDVGGIVDLIAPWRRAACC